MTGLGIGALWGALVLVQLMHEWLVSVTGSF